MKRLLATTIAVLSIAAAANAAVTGSVVDEDGAPIAGATVRAFAYEPPRATAQRVLGGKLERDPLSRAMTADDGTFKLETNGTAVVFLDVTAPGRQVVETALVDGDDAGPVMLPAAKPRRMKVVADGKPVANAVVAVGSTWAAKTGADGLVDVPVYAPPHAGIIVSHPDYASGMIAFDASTTELRMPPSVTVRGQVVGPDGRTPVPHARVSIGNWTTVETADDGSFTIAHAPARWTVLRASSSSGQAVATNNGSASYTIRLGPPASIRGTVRDSKTRAGVAGMILFLSGGRNEGPAMETAVTDAKGGFSFDALPNGDYVLSGQHPAYVLESGGPGTHNTSDRSSRAIVAVPLARVRGTVIDEEKKPVRGAVVGRGAALRLDSARSAVTNGRGEFSLRLTVPPAAMGENELTASKSGYANASSAVKLAAGETTSGVTITLPRGVAVTLKVVDRGRQPIAGATISLSPWRNEAFGRRATSGLAPKPNTTGNDGTVEVRLVPGKYDINVMGDSIVSKALTGEDLGAKSSPFTIVVDRGVELSGRVVASDGAGISDAYVVLMPASSAVETTRTDAGGAFAFHNAARGSGTLEATLPGSSHITSGRKDVTAPATGIVIAMPRGGVITGRVIDEESRQPVTDFILTATHAGTPSPAVSVKNDDGTFVIKDLAAGPTDIAIVAHGYAPASVRGVEVEEGKTTDNVEVQLEHGATIKGRVTSGNGQPEEGVSVTVDSPGGRLVMRAGGAREITDSNGEYLLDSVAPGARQVRFAKAGFISVAKSVDAASGKETALDVTLDRGRELHGRVVDESGQPVASADVRVETEMGPPTRTDGDGTFTITGLRDAHVRVVARKSGYVDARLEDVDPNGPPVTLTLRRGGSISGHVSGLSDADLPGVYVNAVSTGGSAGAAVLNGRVDGAGNFTLQGVADGHFMLEAMTSGPQTRRTPRKGVDVVNGVAPPVELSFAEGFTVRGHITIHGQPLGGAMVSFTPLDPSQGGSATSTRADTDGTYTLTGVMAGAYNALVSSPQFAAVDSQKVTVSGSMIYDVDVQASVVHGRVVDASSGAPVADAQILFQLLDRASGYVSVRPTTSDFSGRFVSDLMAEKKWRLRVQREKYEATTVDVDVSPGMPDVEVRLTPATSAVVRVIDARDGSAIPTAFVVASDSANKPMYSAQTREDGSAQLWVAPGQYTVRANAQRYIGGSAMAEVPGPVVQIVLERAGRIVVASPAQARVRLSGGGMGSPTLSLSGRFENVRPGSYLLELLSNDNKPIQQKTIIVTEWQTTTVTF